MLLNRKLKEVTKMYQIKEHAIEREIEIKSEHVSGIFPTQVRN